MKLLPLVIASLVVGAGLGIGLARNDLGVVETSFFPPMPDGDSPVAPSPLDPSPAGLQAPRIGPSAAVDSELYDFGTMQRGSTETRDFMFTNEGSAPLRLTVGQTTCKCTLGEVAKRPLEPGKSTPVRLEWVAKSANGAFRQVATVLTNDPRRPSIDLTVEGLITETVGLQPSEFLLGRMAADAVGTASLYLASYEEGPDAPQIEATAELSEQTLRPDRFEFTVEQVPLAELPIEGATSGVKITVKAGPGLPIGRLTEWVTFQTNLLKKQRGEGEAERGLTLQTPIYGTVEGDISLHGAGWSKQSGLLHLGKIRSADGREAKLRISFKGENAGDWRAGVLSTEPEWLEVDLGEPIPVREGVVHQPMTIRVPPGRKAMVRSGAGEENGGVGDGDGRVRLSINHPVTTELDVKVRFVIAE